MPCPSDGVFKPARGGSAGPDWLPAWGCPSSSRPPPPPPAPPGCLGPGSVAPSVSNLALCALSAPSSGLWLAWGPLPWCPPLILRDPSRGGRGELPSARAPPPPSGGGARSAGGVASVFQPSLGGHLSAPSPTSCVWLCLGSPLPPRPASSPFIRCHGHDQRLPEKGGRGGGSLWDQAYEAGGIWGCAPWGTASCVCTLGERGYPLGGLLLLPPAP